MNRSPLVPVKQRPGLFAVVTPHAADYLELVRAQVIVDHAGQLFYLTQARRKVRLAEIDAGARLVQLAISADGEQISWTHDQQQEISCPETIPRKPLDQ